MAAPNDAMDVDAAPIAIPAEVGDFKLVVQDELEFAKGVQIAKWQSQSTGLKVVWCGNESALHRLISPTLATPAMVSATALMRSTAITTRLLDAGG